MALPKNLERFELMLNHYRTQLGLYRVKLEKHRVELDTYRATLSGDNLKPLLTDAFLGTLAAAARAYQHEGVRPDMTDFVDWCHFVAGKPLPEIVLPSPKSDEQSTG